MEEGWITILVCLLLAFLYAYISKPGVTRLPVTISTMNPVQTQSIELPSSPAFSSPPKQHSVSKSPKQVSSPMPMPKPIPTLSLAVVFPPYYRKPLSPSISYQQRENAIHSVFSKLAVHLDPEEIVSTQQLLSNSYWAETISVDDINHQLTTRHRSTFGRILEKLMRMAEAEKNEAVKKAGSHEDRRTDPPKVAVRTEIPKQTDAPKQSDAPKQTDAPRQAEVSRPAEVPKTAPIAPFADPAPAVPAASSASLEQIAKEIEETKVLKTRQPKLHPDLTGDLNENVGKITSDVQDARHLSSIAQNCIAAIQRHPQHTQAALLSLAETVLKQCQMNVEDITNGPAFALNYVAFVMEVSTAFPELQRYFRDFLFAKREILIPTLKRNLQDVEARLRLQDPNADSFEIAMNLTRAYGAMRAAMNTHPRSQYDMREGWGWLARILNIAVGQIDRLTIPALTGYLKVLKLRGTLQRYGTQGQKLVSVLQTDYKPIVRTRFWEAHKLYHTFVSMLEEAITDIASDFN